MSKSIPFLRMNGLGNAFIVVDGRVLPPQFTGAQVRAISNSTSGLGCDQLIVIEKSLDESADVFMRIYNEDGGEVDACGNASRCIAAVIGEELGRAHVSMQTNAGLLRAEVKGDLVTVDMGVPQFEWDRIPLSEEFIDTRRIELQIGPIDAPILHTPSVVNVGNPHAVFWAKNDPDEYDLHLFGPLLENHPLFPERANIEIAQVIARDHIKVRVWERGVGLTKACGTGACAVAVCAVRKGLADRDITIDLPGGALALHWRETDSHILMTGPWSLDARGDIPPELLMGQHA